MSDGRWMQDAVREFHKKTDNPAPASVDLDQVRLKLRAVLILEEAIETVEALGWQVTIRENQIVVMEQFQEPDWPEVIDGLCDLLYVTFGTAVEGGFQLGPFFHEVHRSNMTKGHEKDARGKTIKVEGYEPPRIKYLFDRLMQKGK